MGSTSTGMRRASRPFGPARRGRLVRLAQWLAELGTGGDDPGPTTTSSHRAGAGDDHGWYLRFPDDAA